MWVERRSEEARSRDSKKPDANDGLFQRDRARIIHASSFRSLQSKTQVLGLGESDFYRTRLTHSLEVAQVGSGICERLKSPDISDEHQRSWIPSFSLIEAICLAHDIGHPPFGHGGEIATNYLMRDHGGFEGNGQTLRIISRLGEYSESDGLDLTRRTLLGTIKYPAFYDELLNTEVCPPGSKAVSTNLEQWHPPKCIYREEQDVLDWILAGFSESDRKQFRKFETRKNAHSKTCYKAFDTTIMELADDIAYGVHDLEDAIALNLLDRYQWTDSFQAFLAKTDHTPISRELDIYTDRLFSNTNKGRKHAISKLVGYFITSIRITENPEFDHPLLRYQATMEPAAYETLCFLKQLVMQHVILRPELQALQFKGQQAIIKLFGAFADSPDRLLPREVHKEYEENNKSMRIICDYIASMTDVSAGRFYHRLFSPSTGSIFDRV